jgi:hypothetical protein
MKTLEGYELTRFHGCESPTSWENLYQGFEDWKRIVCRESYSHPAKMSPHLCEMIFEHLEALQLIDHETSTVVDFMSGTATTNIIAGIRGYRSVSVELEPRFVRMQMKNREGLAAYTGREPEWRIMQGDARNLSKMLNGGDMASVMSPPYGEGHVRLKDGKLVGKIANYLTPQLLRTSGYETGNMNARGQIQNLKVRAGITSPPYLEAQEDKKGKDPLSSQGYTNPDGSLDAGIVSRNRYRATHFGKGNISRLGVISPPYENVYIASNPKESYGKSFKEGKTADDLNEEFGTGYNERNPKNIGNLSTKAGVVSPPYFKQGEVPKADDPYFIRGRGAVDVAKGSSAKQIGDLKWKKSLGNIGILSPPYSNRFDPGNEKQRHKPGTLQSQVNLGGYGGRKDNIGNLPAITSPPYFNSDNRKPSAALQRDAGLKDNDYGHSKGQLGNLGIISPPYIQAISSKPAHGAKESLTRAGYDPEKYMGGTGRQLTQKHSGLRYSASTENVGNQTPEDYSSAMLKVYSEAFKAGISPLVTVTKNPTRKGALVRLDLMTADLLMKAGYELFDYHQAILVTKEVMTEINLESLAEGDGVESIDRTENKGRIGFFKRLQLAKGGIIAQWEDVIFARIPN